MRGGGTLIWSHGRQEGTVRDSQVESPDRATPILKPLKITMFSCVEFSPLSPLYCPVERVGKVYTEQRMHFSTSGHNLYI